MSDHIDVAIDVLNKALELDRYAVTELVRFRVPCNNKLVEHETVQCRIDSIGMSVSVLGLINGLFGTTLAGNGHIVATVDDGGGILYFSRNQAE